LWSALSSPNLNHDLFVQLSKQAIHVDGPEINDLKTACRENGVFAQIGFNERSRSSLGCLWNSTVLIGDRGQVLNHHRKIVPTYFEKLTWWVDERCQAFRWLMSRANGDGNGLRVVDTRIGRVGALICGENG
jgi:aliphatic nitrilase